jgi:hypothetical protein
MPLKAPQPHQGVKYRFQQDIKKNYTRNRCKRLLIRELREYVHARVQSYTDEQVCAGGRLHGLGELAGA